MTRLGTDMGGSSPSRWGPRLRFPLPNSMLLPHSHPISNLTHPYHSAILSISQSFTLSFFPFCFFPSHVLVGLIPKILSEVECNIISSNCCSSGGARPPNGFLCRKVRCYWWLTDVQPVVFGIMSGPIGPVGSLNPPILEQAYMGRSIPMTGWYQSLHQIVYVWNTK